MTVAASGAERRAGMVRDVASRVTQGYTDEDDDALYGGKASTRGAGAVGGGRAVGASAMRAATYISSPPPLEPKPLSAKGMYGSMAHTSVRAEVCMRHVFTWSMDGCVRAWLQTCLHT